MPLSVDDSDLALCASASLAHHRSVADGSVSRDDPSLRFPVTVRRAGKTTSYVTPLEYVDATRAHRDQILGAASLTARADVEGAEAWGPSLILVRGISTRFDSEERPISSLGFSHVHVRTDDGWKIIAIISDDL